MLELRHFPREMVSSTPALSQALCERLPGPRGHRLLGSLLQVRRDPLGFAVRAHREHGDLVEFRMPGRRLVLVTEPWVARQVLVHNQKSYRKGLGLDQARSFFGAGLLTSEEEVWSAQRRSLQPVFDRGGLAQFARVCAQAAERQASLWAEQAAADGTTDVSSGATRYALEVLEHTFLPADLSSRAPTIARDLGAISRWAMRRMASLLPGPTWLPTPTSLAARRALSRLRALAAEPRQGSSTPLDVLAHLGAEGPGEDGTRYRDQFLTFLLAGHETSAAALTWTLYLLAGSPVWQERAREEALRWRRDGQPDDVDVPPALGAVVDEALRLYPPVWMLTRKAMAPDHLGPCLVPAGTDVLVNVYSLQRHPGHWSNPEAFDPGRFEDLSAPPLAYLPFGLGGRACIGRLFGRFEVIVALAAVLRRCCLAPAAEPPPEIEAGLTLRPRRGLRLALRPLPAGGP